MVSITTLVLAPTDTRVADVRGEWTTALRKSAFMVVVVLLRIMDAGDAIAPPPITGVASSVSRT